MRRRVGPGRVNGGSARNSEDGNIVDGSEGEGADARELRVDNFWRDTIPVIERFREQGMLFSVCLLTPPCELRLTTQVDYESDDGDDDREERYQDLKRIINEVLCPNFRFKRVRT